MKLHMCYGINISTHSKEKIERLVRSGNLKHLVFGYSSFCIDCVKGKFIKSRKKLHGSKPLLEIILSSYSGHSCLSSFNGHVISYFTNDFSYFIHFFKFKKNQVSLNLLKFSKLK